MRLLLQTPTTSKRIDRKRKQKKQDKKNEKFEIGKNNIEGIKIEIYEIMREKRYS